MIIAGIDIGRAGFTVSAGRQTAGCVTLAEVEGFLARAASPDRTTSTASCGLADAGPPPRGGEEHEA